MDIDSAALLDESAAVFVDAHAPVLSESGAGAAPMGAPDPPATCGGDTLWIEGVKVVFPFSPYKSQRQMMVNVIRALKRKENALLESPTGSGKTMALLCAALAWQKHAIAQANSAGSAADDLASAGGAAATASERLFKKPRVGSTSPVPNHTSISLPPPQPQPQQQQQQRPPPPQPNLISLPPPPPPPPPPQQQLQQLQQLPPPDVALNSRLESFRFVPSSKTADSNADDADFEPTSLRKRKHVELEAEPIGANEGASHGPDDEPDEQPAQAAQAAPEAAPRERVPQIFFCTRTHSQVAQVVHELANTIYRPRMVILASREHLCIHPRVRDKPNKNEECDSLLDVNMCHFKRGAPSLAIDRNFIPPAGAQAVWDIEDIVRKGEKKKACPYFGVREMLPMAEIVFCPYNYLVAPSIRESSGINIKGAIVIVDEAHNIEDAARDAGSCELKEEAIHTLLIDLKVGADLIDASEAAKYQPMMRLGEAMLAWMERVSRSGEMIEADFESTIALFADERMRAALADWTVTRNSYEFIYLAAYNAICARAAQAKEDQMDSAYRASRESVQTLGTLFSTFAFLFADDEEFFGDFRLVLERKKDSSSASSRASREKAARKRRQKVAGAGASEFSTSIRFWCLNPAVVFRSLSSQTRSIVLTSGTLAPLVSFASELATPFALTLEADHVIDMQRQVFAGALGVSPGGKELTATYQNTDSFTFQDELGATLVALCSMIPAGVLVFFPSYSLISKLCDRWRATHMWQRLEAVKHIVVEPRTKENGGFDDALAEYYAAIRQAQAGTASHTGAMMLAVFRGKASEGIDFSDDNARGVICVGIPFPNVRDQNVKAKREYNTSRNRAGKGGVINGNDWYTLQAFRALNQALGRCIRHRRDYGSIVLLDARFCDGDRNVFGLSKWMRGCLVQYRSFNALARELHSFHEGCRRLSWEAAAGGLAHEASAGSLAAPPIQLASSASEPSPPGGAAPAVVRCKACQAVLSRPALQRSALTEVVKMGLATIVLRSQDALAAERIVISSATGGDYQNWTIWPLACASPLCHVNLGAFIADARGADADDSKCVFLSKAAVELG